MNKNITGIVYLMGYLFTLINNYVFKHFTSQKELTFKVNSVTRYPNIVTNTSLSSPNMYYYNLCYFLIPQFLNIHFVRNPLSLHNIFLKTTKSCYYFLYF